MKINFKVLTSILVCSVITFSSCSDSNDNDLVSPSLQSYWPLKTGNTWHLEDKANKDSLNYTIFHKINVENKEYYSFIDQNDTVNYPLAVQESNGIFRMYYAPTTQGNAQIGGGNITYLQLQKAVNEVWTDNMTLSYKTAATEGTLTYTHTGKIIDKKDSEEINGKTYRDVIKTELIQKISNSVTKETTEIKEEYWLAKGIGPLKATLSGDDFNNTYELVDYKLK